MRSLPFPSLRVALLALMLSLPSLALAGGPDLPPPGAFLRVAAEIGLSEGQSRQVQDIIFQHESALVDIDARLQRAELEMRHYMMAETLDEKAIFKALDTLNAAQADKRKNRTQLALALRKVMSAEQWGALMKMREERRHPELPPAPEPPPLPGGR